MPLPDATKDQRIYQLLKNIDLGNLTFEEFQTAAQTVFAEPEAEDTLRRIVLVNLARMSVAGDWDGLTSAGGAGAATFTKPPTVSGWSYSTTWSGYGMTTSSGSASTYAATAFNAPNAFPMIAQASGNMSSLTLNVIGADTGDNVLVGIYTDVGGIPSALIGSAVISCNSTGYITQTSFSATVTLVAGTAYWIVFGNSDNTTGATVRIVGTKPTIPIVLDGYDESCGAGWKHNADVTSLPATFVIETDTLGTIASRRPFVYYSL